MKNIKIFLGAEIGMQCLTISSFLEEGNIIHETYALEQNRNSDEILEKINLFIENFHKDQKVERFVYTCENYPLSKCRLLEKRLREEEIGNGGIHLISKENALIRYVMHQTEDTYRHTVFMFEFDGKELISYRLYHPKKKSIKEIVTEKKVLGTVTCHSDQQIFDKVLDRNFAELAGKLLSKEVVSTVYLTGTGFEGGWMQRTLRVLCDGRRAFYGQNLISDGCCYYAGMLAEKKQPEYLVQAPETVLYQSGVLDSKTEDQFIQITDAGSAWYETKGSLELLVERGNRIDLMFVHSRTKEKQVESVELGLLASRPAKMGRYRVMVEFLSGHSGVITVLDQGFGSFLPSTHQVFVKEFTLL